MEITLYIFLHQMITSSTYNRAKVYIHLQTLEIIAPPVYMGTCCNCMLSIPIHCFTHLQPICPTVLLYCVEQSTYSSHGSGLLSKWVMLGTRYWLQMVRMHRSVPVRVCGVVTPPNLICSPSMRSGI